MKIGNLEVYGTIYMITNNINNKVYIGQTTIKFNKRYSSGKWYKNTSSKLLKMSVEKYGKEFFTLQKLKDIAFSKEELDIKETIYIKLYKATDYNYGYNLQEGGSHGKHSLVSRKLMGVSQKARFKNNPIWNKGIPMTKEIKKRMSDSRTGIPSGRLGISVPNNTGVNHIASKKVICLNTLETFINMRVASKKYNLQFKNIHKCCIGERKYCGEVNGIGMMWEYYNNYLELNKSDIENRMILAKDYKECSPKRVINLNTNEIFKTAKEASIKYKIDGSALSKVCRGKLKTCGGFKWAYYEFDIKGVG